MILYPTETIYALGVNAFEQAEIAKLYELKGRPDDKPVSLLVRDMEDVKRWGVMSPRAAAIAAAHLPGPLTLVLPARDTVPSAAASADGTVSFRISSDSLAQQLIADFMQQYDAPLTCTSANVSGLPTLETPADILQQFGERAGKIDRVIDGGCRTAAASTVVRVAGDEVTIHRVGAISEAAILGIVY